MTRVLAELLGAREPAFHQGLFRLELASGRPGADIRLSTDIERVTRFKLRELGLDPGDTTGLELYRTLQERIKADDARLAARLRASYGREQPVHVLVSRALDALPLGRNCFALKTSIARRILAKLPPKQTMKLLGYRSFESMLRREPLLAIFGAAWLIESAHWHTMLLDQYKKLPLADFEIRPLAILAPVSARWQKLAASVVAQKKHTVITLKELGAVVLLPFPPEAPPAAAMTALIMGLHAMNDVRAASTFLKLSQVRPDFGACLVAAVAGEPTLPADLLDQPLPWQIVQRYYARFTDRFRDDLFEPHVQREDLTWHSVEKALSFIDPNLAFWQHTSTLGLLADHQAVSLNVIDAALNYCNQLPYRGRTTEYFRSSLWAELMIRYLKHDTIEQAVLSSLESKLIHAEPFAAEMFDE